MKKALAAAKQRGFTLIELIVTIVIVGILAGIAIVGYTGVTSDAQDKADAASAEINARRVAMHMALNDTAMTEAEFMSAVTEVGSDLEGQFAEGTPGDGVVTYRPSGVTDDSRDVSVTIADFGIGGGSDDGSSESADPYAGWDSYTDSQGQTYYWTVDRTGVDAFTMTGVFEGVAPSTTLQEQGSSSLVTGVDSFNLGLSNGWFYDGGTQWYPASGSGALDLYTNANGDAEWSLSAASLEPAWNYSADASEKIWVDLFPLTWQDSDGTVFQFATRDDYASFTLPQLVIPAYTG